MKNIVVFFIILLLSCCESEKKKPIEKMLVGIQPYDDFPTETANKIGKVIDSFYGFNYKILQSKPIPEAAFVAIKSPRYKADKIINIQMKEQTKEIDLLLGLTQKDISITKKDKNGKVLQPEWKYNDFGIMGLAYRPGTSCVVSAFRLKHPNKTVVFTRLKKVVIHELGHNLGLPHCPNKKCVMTSAAKKLLPLITN